VSDPFVWFDLRTRDAEASRNFYEELLGWDVSDPIAGGGGVRAHGSEQPWASVVPDGGDNIGWFPYVQVADLESATERAKELGATVLQAATQGPAGTFTPIREPGGAVFALFQPRQ
jgi:predicted enzyme related to lactoylglutathione lyase